MDLHRYVTLAVDNHKRYEFLSSGPKGIIKKVVTYIEMAPGIYNLGFGDWDNVMEEIKDHTRTHNGDRDKVLATVASTVMEFIEHYPAAIIIAKGETPAKTRLYQMGINANWNEISGLFYVEGYINGKWEPFSQGKNYDTFALWSK